MNIKEYTQLAITTAVHDTKEKGYTCLLFGLLGEWAELEEKLLDSFSSNEEEIKKEFGDFFWYLINYAHKLDVVPKKVYVNMFEETPWQVIATIQEYNKKLYRDKDWVLSEEDVSFLWDKINILYSMLIQSVETRGFNISDIFQMNIEKLFSRKERGVISGSGDNR